MGPWRRLIKSIGKCNHSPLIPYLQWVLAAVWWNGRDVSTSYRCYDKYCSEQSLLAAIEAWRGFSSIKDKSNHHVLLLHHGAYGALVNGWDTCIFGKGIWFGCQVTTRSTAGKNFCCTLQHRAREFAPRDAKQIYFYKIHVLCTTTIMHTPIWIYGPKSYYGSWYPNSRDTKRSLEVRYARVRRVFNSNIL